VALVVSWLVAAAGLAAPPLVLPSSDAPATVAALGSLERAQAFGLSADGTVTIASFPSERGASRSVLRVARAGAAVVSIELPGEVLALVVTAAGESAFAIVREVDRKGVVRQVELTPIDLRSGRLAPAIDLPVSARGIALGAGEASLLVAARDELRTFTLPGLTSGPLYRVPGDNRAVAPLTGSTRVLVGRGASVMLVDLAAAQGREGLPAIETVETGATVKVIVSAPGEPSAIALLENGEAATIGTDPLTMTPRGPALAIAWPGVKAPAAVPAPVPVTVAAPVVAAQAPPIAEAEPPPIEPDPQVDPPKIGGGADADEAAAAAGAAAAGVSVAPAPLSPPSPPVTVEDPVAAPSPSVDDVPPSSPTGRGRVTGPARADARNIVFLGPNNILKEAARTPIESDGTYAVPQLAPGSYRVLAAGAQGRVVLCRPEYLTIQVGEAGPPAIPDIEVVRPN
jgi:hypothetical protein